MLQEKHNYVNLSTNYSKSHETHHLNQFILKKSQVSSSTQTKESNSNSSSFKGIAQADKTRNHKEET